MKKFFALFAVLALCASVFAEADWTNFSEFQRAFADCETTATASIPVWYKGSFKLTKAYDSLPELDNGETLCDVLTVKPAAEPYYMVLCQPCLVCCYDCEAYECTGNIYNLADASYVDEEECDDGCNTRIKKTKIKALDIFVYDLDDAAFFNYDRWAKSQKNKNTAFSIELDGMTGFGVGTKDYKSWKFGKAGSFKTAIVKSFAGIFYFDVDEDPSRYIGTGTFSFTRDDSNTKKLMAAMFGEGSFCEAGDVLTCEEVIVSGEDTLVEELLLGSKYKKYEINWIE